MTFAQTQVQLQQVANGLGFITDIAHAGDDRMFILARNGIVRIVQDGQVQTEPYLDITSFVTTTGEMGALGLAFDPDFQNNGRFYIHYNSNQGGWWSRIARFTADDAAATTVDASTQQILLQIPQDGSFHNGGDLDFGPDGTLYLTLGDSFSSASAQDLTHPLGSIHRIDVSDGGDSYTIPVDDPYATAGGDTIPTIWAKGLRNPFRFGFDALTGDMWIGDVGSTGWEEINFWPAGDHSGPNFGWRCYEGFVPASIPTPGCGPAANYVMPVAVQPTSGAWCSIIAGRVYRGNDFPALHGRFLYSDYCAGVIHALEQGDEGEWIDEQLASGLGNGIICIGENSDLELFLGKSDGTLHRIIMDTSVGVSEDPRPQIMVAPNPSDDVLIIEGPWSGTVDISLRDLAGRMLRRNVSQDQRQQIATSDLPAGNYLLQVMDADGQLLLARQVSVQH